MKAVIISLVLCLSFSAFAIEPANPNASNKTRQVLNYLMSLSGNDAEGLAKNKNDTTVLIDAVGKEDTASSTGRSVASVDSAAKIFTLVRNFPCYTKIPTGVARPEHIRSMSEWQVFNTDTFYNPGVFDTAWTGVVSSSWNNANNRVSDYPPTA